MKTLVSIVITLICSTLAINATANLSYLITSDDTILCKDIKIGIRNMRITLINGEKQKVEKGVVNSFLIDGKKYDRMPEFIDGRSTGKNKFMELLCQRNGLKLYKNTFYCCGGWNTSKNSIESSGDKTILLVYKGNDYYLQLDKKNAQTLSEYFHLQGLRFN
jgi:hypothetical protein